MHQMAHHELVISLIIYTIRFNKKFKGLDELETKMRLKTSLTTQITQSLPLPFPHLSNPLPSTCLQLLFPSLAPYSLQYETIFNQPNLFKTNPYRPLCPNDSPSPTVHLSSITGPHFPPRIPARLGRWEIKS